MGLITASYSSRQLPRHPFLQIAGRTIRGALGFHIAGGVSPRLSLQELHGVAVAHLEGKEEKHGVGSWREVVDEWLEESVALVADGNLCCVAQLLLAPLLFLQ